MKNVWLYIIVFLFIAPSFAYGHTELEESTPEEGAAVEEPVEEIELLFGTEIEEQSTVKLTGGSGEEIPVSVSIEGSRLTAIPDEPLAMGEYEAAWIVVGADGHPVEGILSFEVSEIREDVSEDVVEETPEAEMPDEEAEEQEETDREASSVEEEQSNPLVWMIILVVCLTLGVLLGTWIIKRRK